MLKARIKSPAALFPEAMQAMQGLGKALESGSVSPQTLSLVHLRASQINGCSVCVDLHSRDLKRHGDADERIFGVAAWRDNPAFNEAEPAALALTERVTCQQFAERQDAGERGADVVRERCERGLLGARRAAAARCGVPRRLRGGLRFRP